MRDRSRIQDATREEEEELPGTLPRAGRCHHLRSVPPPLRPASREGNGMEGPTDGKGEHGSRLLRPGGGSSRTRLRRSELTP
jgi:hypothetical protein